MSTGDNSWRLGEVAGGEGFGTWEQSVALQLPKTCRGIDDKRLPLSRVIGALHSTVIVGSAAENDFNSAKHAFPVMMAMCTAAYCSAHNRITRLPELLQRHFERGDLEGMELGNYDVKRMYALGVRAYYLDASRPDEWPTITQLVDSQSASAIKIGRAHV